MNETDRKLFVGVDARGGEINDYSTPLCANMDVRGTELRSRKGYDKMFLVSLKDPIMGIFNYITKYLKNISLPRYATIIEDNVLYRDVYSDGSYIWLVDVDETRMRLTKYNNGAKTHYTLSGDYAGEARIFEYGGSMRILHWTDTTLSVITFNGSTMSLTDSRASTEHVYGVFVSSIASLAYFYGNINFQFDGSTISDGPALLGGSTIIQAYSETATAAYLIQAGGIIQRYSAGSWVFHASDVYVDQVEDICKIGTTTYLFANYSSEFPGTEYGIYTYDGTTLTREFERRVQCGGTDGTKLYAMDNSVGLFGDSLADMKFIGYIWTPTPYAGVRMAVLNGIAYSVGGKFSRKGIAVIEA